MLWYELPCRCMCEPVIISCCTVLFVAVDFLHSEYTGLNKVLATCDWKKTALDRRRTDRIILTHNLDLWPWLSIPCELWSWPTHMKKLKVNGQSIPKIEQNQMDRGDWITCHIDAVGKHLSLIVRMITWLENLEMSGNWLKVEGSVWGEILSLKTVYCLLHIGVTLVFSKLLQAL